MPFVTLLIRHARLWTRTYLHCNMSYDPRWRVSVVFRLECGDRWTWSSSTFAARLVMVLLLLLLLMLITVSDRDPYLKVKWHWTKHYWIADGCPVSSQQYGYWGNRFLFSFSASTFIWTLIGWPSFYRCSVLIIHRYVFCISQFVRSGDLIPSISIMLLHHWHGLTSIPCNLINDFTGLFTPIDAVVVAREVRPFLQ